MKRLGFTVKFLLPALAALVLLQPVPVLGAQVNWVPDTNAWSGWTVTWHAVNSLNDPNDGLGSTHLDFVGDSLSPGVYWNTDANYVYFRARVAAGTVTSSTYADTVMVVIDKIGTGVANQPDFAFAWDSKAALASHGLEMMVTNTVGTTWGATKMDDLDGMSAAKGTNDINGNSRTTDGFIRTIDSQATANFGTTSFIDFAVSWNYLTNYTVLRPNDSWKIQMASINGVNDHNFLSYDIAGGINPASLIDAKWSDILVVPEPSSGLLVTGGLVLMARLRRRSRR
ncbi:MAG: PEP-CTERM sorting domain-containing protein [Verrucomicrobia bacterium]|nr:PEP-CTERM sorting domain-containing protein [Verrucomicrobiota bacterium]